MIVERFSPSSGQIERLSDEVYEELLGITLAKLEAIESADEIPDIASMDEAEIEAWLDAQWQQIELDLELPINALLEQNSPLSDFEKATADIVVAGILTLFLFSMGGVAGLRQRGQARAFVRQANQTIRGSLAGIRGTATRIAEGKLTPRQIQSSKGRRALQSRQVYEREKILGAIANGFHNEGIRMLQNPHPCPDCPGHQRLDWVPISDIVPPTVACRCQSRCKCKVITRFNPERALQELTGGDITSRVTQYEDGLANHERRYLDSMGWHDPF